jgi:WD40 repeat protein
MYIASGSCSSTQSLLVWDASAGGQTPLETFDMRQEERMVTSVDWSRDGSSIASGSYKGFVWFWSTSFQKDHVVPKGTQTFCEHLVVWSPNAEFVATIDTHSNMRVWDATTGRQAMDAVKGHVEDNPQCICKYRKYNFEVLDECPVTAHVWESVSWPVKGTHITNAGADNDDDDDATAMQVCESCILGGVGTSASSATSENVGAGPIFTARRVTRYPNELRRDENKILIWDLHNDKQVGSIEIYTDDPHYDMHWRWPDDCEMSWSPNGKYIAIRSRVGEVKVWDAATFEIVIPSMTLVPEINNGKNTLMTWAGISSEIPSTEQGMSGAKIEDDTFMVFADGDRVLVYVLQGLTKSVHFPAEFAMPSKFHNDKIWTISCMNDRICVVTAHGQVRKLLSATCIHVLFEMFFSTDDLPRPERMLLKRC